MDLSWTRRPEDFPAEQQMLSRLVGRVWSKPSFVWPAFALVRRVEPVWVAFYDDFGVRSSPNERVWYVIQHDPNSEGYGRIVDGEPLHFFDALLRAQAYDEGFPAPRQRFLLTLFAMGGEGPPSTGPGVPFD